MKQIAPYLFFDGNCRDVLNFYKECFGGELSIMTVGESPMAEKSDPKDHNRVLHGAIMKDKQLMLMASDTMVPGQTAEMGEGVYNTIICSNKEEFEMIFNKLAEGGKIVMPMEKAFFGYFGSLSDKFGTKWMLEFDQPNE
jgi:PhnB protein